MLRFVLPLVVLLRIRHTLKILQADTYNDPFAVFEHLWALSSHSVLLAVWESVSCEERQGMRQRVVCCIPARFASSRLPGKPLRDIGGQSVLLRTVSRVLQCKFLDDVFVATDDDRIRSHVEEKSHVKCIMTNPACETGTDRVYEACSGFGLAQMDWVVNVQGDEPFVNPEHIDSLVEAMKSQETCEMGTICVEEIDEKAFNDMNVVKLVRDNAGHALYFSRCPIPHGDGQSFLRHVGVYAFTFGFLTTFCTELKQLPLILEKLENLEQLRALESGHAVKAVTVSGPVEPGIDTEEQLAEAKMKFYV